LLLLDTPITPETFSGTHYSSVNGAMWTIHYEFICYLTVSGLGVSGILKYRKLFLVLIAALGVLFAAKNFGSLTLLGITPIDTEQPLIRFYCFFFTGGLFYFYRHRILYKKTNACFASAMIFVGMLFTETAELSILLFGSYLLFYFAFTERKSLTWFYRIPDASYGVYLYGWPIGKLLTWYIPTIAPWTLALLTAFLAFGFGLLSWQLVEKPALRLKAYRSERSRVKVGAI
jgi:peptidoglycan/LPS O-acetylase OafA/YrhL